MRLSTNVTAAIAVAAAMTACGAASAQDAPHARGPFYHLSKNDRTQLLFAGGSLSRSGEVASTVVVMATNPTQFAESGTSWAQVHYDFNCASDQYRATHGESFDAQGAQVDAQRADAYWSAVPDGSNLQIMRRMACSGPGSNDTIVRGSPASIAEAFRAGQ